MQVYTPFLIGVVVGFILYMIYMSFTQKTSYFTSVAFNDTMSPADATKSYTDQTKAISDEMKDALLKASQEKKNHAEMNAISDKFSDQLCNLNKSFSHYQINRIPV